MNADTFGSLWRGFMPARVIFTANEFKVFERLQKSPKTAKQLASLMKTDLRATELLLNALVGIKLLKKKSNKYENTKVSRNHLLPDGKDYQGNMLLHGSSMWENWGALSETLISGKPPRKSFDLDSFIKAMDDVSRFRAPELVRKLPLKGVKTALDLGGGPGTNAIALAKKGIEVTLFDYPDTIKIARKYAAKAKVKLNYKKGDFASDPIGSGYDLILVSQVLHTYGEAESIAILKKCYDAINTGGMIAVQEIPLKDDHTVPARGSMFAINMLVATDGGRVYTASEIKAWLKQTGLKNIKHKELSETTLVMGIKK